MTSAVSGLDAAMYRDEPQPYYVTALGSNRDLCFVAVEGTTDPAIEIEVAGNNTPLTVSVASEVVTVHSATDAGGVATSTAAAILAAIRASATASALLRVRLPPGQTGAGVTGSLTHTHVHDGVVFAALAMADSGDHLTYQAAAGYRYWDEDETTTIYSDGGEVTSGFTINHLRGSVTFDASMVGHTITASGTRRAENAFRKIINLYSARLKIQGREVDTTSCEDAGWGSSLLNRRGWSLTSEAYYYYNVLTYPNVDLADLGAELFAKIYSEVDGSSFVGIGRFQETSYVLANPNAAQSKSLTFNGSGEVYPE